MMASNTLVDAATLTAAAALLGGTLSNAIGGGNRVVASGTGTNTGTQASLSEGESTSASRGTSSSQSAAGQQWNDIAKNLFKTTELPLLTQGFEEQLNLFAPFLTGDNAFLTNAYGGVGDIVKQASRGGGVGDLGPVYEGLSGLSPELLAALQNLVMQRGAAVQSVVAPNFGSFLAPASASQSQSINQNQSTSQNVSQTATQSTSSGTSSQTQAQPTAFDTGFGLATNLASFIASAAGLF